MTFLPLGSRLNAINYHFGIHKQNQKIGRVMSLSKQEDISKDQYKMQ